MQAYVVKRVLAYLAGGEKTSPPSMWRRPLSCWGTGQGGRIPAHGITVQQSYGNLLFYKNAEREIPEKELEFHVFPGKTSKFLKKSIRNGSIMIK